MQAINMSEALIEVKAPILPEATASARLLRLYVTEGESIRANQTLLELETENVILEIVAPCNGVVDSIEASLGADVCSEQRIMFIKPLNSNEPSLQRQTATPSSFDSQVENEQNKKLRKFAMYIGIAIFTLVFGYFKVIETNNEINTAFSEQVFNIEGVTTELVYFTQSKSSADIKFESNGLPNRADSYKPEILNYVCSHPALQKELKKGKVVVFNMSAKDRSDGNFVNMRIDTKRCKTARH